MPSTPYRVALPLAVAYFVAGGVLALWFPADGLDLRVSFVAGRAALDGVSPYERAAYIRTWQSLPTPPELATTIAFPFAYPPTWIPVCVALALLPWSGALVVWKLLNVAFLVGSVVLTFRLLQGHALTASDRYAAWCFALVLSPTISVMAIGQASLFVLFMLLTAGYALQQRRPTLAGVALALALTKPQMAVPFVLFLLFRGAIGALTVAAMCVAVLAALGLWLSHSDLGTYLAAITTYADFAEPTSHVAVGIGSLLAHLSALDPRNATLMGAIVGIALTALVSFRARAREPLPALLYLGPLAFHCNSYSPGGHPARLPDARGAPRRGGRLPGRRVDLPELDPGADAAAGVDRTLEGSPRT